MYELYRFTHATKLILRMKKSNCSIVVSSHLLHNMRLLVRTLWRLEICQKRQSQSQFYSLLDYGMNIIPTRADKIYFYQTSPCLQELLVWPCLWCPSCFMINALFGMRAWWDEQNHGSERLLCLYYMQCGNNMCVCVCVCGRNTCTRHCSASPVTWRMYWDLGIIRLGGGFENEGLNPPICLFWWPSDR